MYADFLPVTPNDQPAPLGLPSQCAAIGRTAPSSATERSSTKPSSVKLSSGSLAASGTSKRLSTIMAASIARRSPNRDQLVTAAKRG